MARTKLTPKQIRFCEEFVIDNNGKQAAIRAGYSKRSAEVTASKLLRNAKVQETITALKEQIKDRNLDLSDQIILELKKIAFGSLADFFRVTSDGTMTFDARGATREQIDSLSEISTEEFMVGVGEDTRPAIRIKIKQHSKLKALELLMLHLGILRTKVDIEHSGSVEFDLFGLSTDQLKEIALKQGE